MLPRLWCYLDIRVENSTNTMTTVRLQSIRSEIWTQRSLPPQWKCPVNASKGVNSWVWPDKPEWVMSYWVKNENLSAEPKTKQLNLTAPYCPVRRNGSQLSSLIKFIFNSTQGCRSVPWRQNIYVYQCVCMCMCVCLYHLPSFMAFFFCQISEIFQLGPRSESWN